MQAQWGIGARPRDVSGLSAQGLLVAAAVCLILTAVEGEGCWRLMGTTRVVDAAAHILYASIDNEAAAKIKKPLASPS